MNAPGVVKLLYLADFGGLADLAEGEGLSFEKMEMKMSTDKRFLNYEDPDWTKDEYEWLKNEDGTDIKKEANGSTNT